MPRRRPRVAEDPADGGGRGVQGIRAQGGGAPAGRPPSLDRRRRARGRQAGLTARRARDSKPRAIPRSGDRGPSTGVAHFPQDPGRGASRAPGESPRTRRGAVIAPRSSAAGTAGGRRAAAGGSEVGETIGEDRIQGRRAAGRRRFQRELGSIHRRDQSHRRQQRRQRLRAAQRDPRGDGEGARALRERPRVGGLFGGAALRGRQAASSANHRRALARNLERRQRRPSGRTTSAPTTSWPPSDIRAEDARDVIFEFGVAINDCGQRGVSSPLQQHPRPEHAQRLPCTVRSTPPATTPTVTGPARCSASLEDAARAAGRSCASIKRQIVAGSFPWSEQ